MAKQNTPERSTVYLNHEDRERLEQLQAVYRSKGFDVSYSAIVRMLVIKELKLEAGETNG